MEHPDLTTMATATTNYGKQSDLAGLQERAIICTYSHLYTGAPFWELRSSFQRSLTLLMARGSLCILQEDFASVYLFDVTEFAYTLPQTSFLPYQRLPT